MNDSPDGIGDHARKMVAEAKASDRKITDASRLMELRELVDLLSASIRAEKRAKTLPWKYWASAQCVDWPAYSAARKELHELEARLMS